MTTSRIVILIICLAAFSAPLVAADASVLQQALSQNLPEPAAIHGPDRNYW